MSTDSVEANAAFAEKYSFPFPLLSDTARDVCLAYGACDSPTASARRITFVIGPDGRILQVYEHVDAKHHVEMLLASLSTSTNPAQHDVSPAAEAISQVRSGVDIPYNRSKEMDDSNQNAKPIMNQEPAAANSEASLDQPFAAGEHDTGLSTSGPEVGALPFVAPTMPIARVPASAMSVQPSQVPPTQHSDALQLVYALGTIGHDLGTEARRDAFIQAMPGEGNNPNDPRQLLAYLAENPYEAAGVIWTLSLDATPIYAIRPAGPYASIAYDRLREFYNARLAGEVEQSPFPVYWLAAPPCSPVRRYLRLYPNCAAWPVGPSLPWLRLRLAHGLRRRTWLPPTTNVGTASPTSWIASTMKCATWALVHRSEPRTSRQPTSTRPDWHLRKPPPMRCNSIASQWNAALSVDPTPTAGMSYSPSSTQLGARIKPGRSFA